jgi:hypothetical protein
LPLPVRIWLVVLGLFNMLIPLFLLGHFEARIMVIATALSAAIGVLLHKAKGMTNILGLMHAPWLGRSLFSAHENYCRRSIGSL